MNDRELLELSAKAAGHITRSDRFEVWIVETDGSPIARWNPLKDDAQALRLAVKLALTIDIQHHETEVFTWEGECLSSEHVFVHPDHSYKATRRAIVEAAAEIGKTRSE